MSGWSVSAAPQHSSPCTSTSRIEVPDQRVPTTPLEQAGCAFEPLEEEEVELAMTIEGRERGRRHLAGRLRSEKSMAKRRS